MTYLHSKLSIHHTCQMKNLKLNLRKGATLLSFFLDKWVQGKIKNWSSHLLVIAYYSLYNFNGYIAQKLDVSVLGIKRFWRFKASGSCPAVFSVCEQQNALQFLCFMFLSNCKSSCHLLCWDSDTFLRRDKENGDWYQNSDPVVPVVSTDHR